MPLRAALFKICLLFAALEMGQLATAQAPPPYESISTAQGLSQGMVFDLLQDNKGFIWVATKDGLNRYDGYTFTVFSNDPYNSNSLSSNTVVKLLEDSRGHIWAGTEDAGLNVYDKKSDRFYRITHSPADDSSLSGNVIRWIEELPDGRMLVAADGAGFNIVQLPEDFFTKPAKPLIKRLSLPGATQVYGAGKDVQGRVWIGGMDGAVYQFHPATYSFTPLPGGQLLNNGYLTSDSSILINNYLFLLDGKEATPLFDTANMQAGNILLRPREKLWENHHREPYFYDVSWWQPGKPVQWNVQLPNHLRLVYPFITDRSGIIWSGSVGYGLRKYLAGSRFKPALPHYSVRWIVPRAATDILLGDHAYGWRGLTPDSVAASPFAHIPAVTQIDNFIFLKDSTYWLKSDKDGYYGFDPATGKLTAYGRIHPYQGRGDKQPMLQDSKGYIWMPGLGGHFMLLHKERGSLDSFSINTNAANPMLPKAICTALYEDGQGTMWVGTQEGFAKLIFPGSRTTPRVTWYYNQRNSRNSLNYNHVSAFLDDPARPNDYLWICTKGGGLNRLNKKTGDFYHLTTKNGLPHDVVYGLLADDAGNLWGSTNRGIFCLLKHKAAQNEQPEFRYFTKADGLQDDEFNTGAYARLPNGQLAFGGVNGVNIFDPKKALAAGFSPNVFITNMLINNAPVTAGDKHNLLTGSLEETKNITLNYLQDILTLEFASLDFTAPAQNKYRYQLVGVDKDWVESGNRRSATYLHLPAGSYDFKVQGSNSQGIWSNKIASLHITVLPPWWRTGWAYTLYAMLVLFVIRAYFNFSVNRARLRAQLSYEQLEAKRMKELDTLKTQLYTNITHEFRTPLTVILGTAQQLLNKPTENFAHGMNMIIRNGQSLLKLVNEMLDLSKLESGKMSLHLVNGDIINYLRYVTESFHSFAEGKNIGLHFLTQLGELHVAYDPEKMRQIMVNLLSNALKFTSERGNVYITVGTSEMQGDDQKIMLVLSVKDTGIGIPENEMEHIFDRFHQLDNSHTRTAGGTGIGLALTKELVNLLEGDIAVKSPPPGANKGSEFTVRLPLKTVPANNGERPYPEMIKAQPPAEAALMPSQPSTADNDCDKPLLLLVEDNADVVAYTASCLPHHRLAVGKNGKEGFDIATEKIPDLIITDVMMPLMDGFELVRQLRNHETTSHIPVIMLTAKADRESRLAGLQQGADAYLEKPFHREELLLQVNKLLQLRKSLQHYYLRKTGLTNGSPAPALPAAGQTPAAKGEDKFVKKVREVVAANLGNADFTVEQLCRLVFMSHSQLHRKLEALTGCPPNKFIRMIRINKAKELLKDPEHSIGSIALDCGYNDPAYFSRVFKQEYGVTPQEWRASHRVAE